MNKHYQSYMKIEPDNSNKAVPYLWGFAAEAFTPQELRTKAGQDLRLLRIAVTLEAIENQRYSGMPPTHLPVPLQESLAAALDLLQKRQRP